MNLCTDADEYPYTNRWPFDEPSPSPAPHITLAGNLDPTTGIFYRTPEHPRMRTASFVSFFLCAVLRRTSVLRTLLVAGPRILVSALPCAVATAPVQRARIFTGFTPKILSPQLRLRVLPISLPTSKRIFATLVPPKSAATALLSPFVRQRRGHRGTRTTRRQAYTRRKMRIRGLLSLSHRREGVQYRSI
ncbi:hypothetical protein B0H19DRAFT_1236907 [Mycena capillaripes]|nr:hypothetical protein B0H19DRAFT_1236907 [Mycena capillaripes]